MRAGRELVVGRGRAVGPLWPDGAAGGGEVSLAGLTFNPVYANNEATVRVVGVATWWSAGHLRQERGTKGLPSEMGSERRDERIRSDTHKGAVTYRTQASKISL